MDERRQLPRWQVKREATVWLPQMEGSSQCMIEDMNLKGMRASFSKRLPQEWSVNMSLGLEDSFGLMKIEVNLPWAREVRGRYVYGMSFNKITDADKDRIDQYINSHCSAQFKDKWWAVQK